MDIVNIAVVGLGQIGPRHAQAILQSPSARLVCFVDPSAHAETAAQAFEVPVFTSIAFALDAGIQIHAAVVCTPNHTHVSLASELISAGIAVLVEKPISITTEDGRSLVALSEARSVPLLVGHHRRFNPYITAIAEIIKSGAIGRPIATSGLWTTYKPESYFAAPTEWRASAAAGGGPISINLVHDIDLLQYLLGPIIRVSAEKTLSQRSHGDDAAEEGAAVLLRFENGVVATFILSDSVPSNHSFEAGTGENPIIPRSGKDFYRIFGTEGTLSVGDMKITRFADGVEKSWSSSLVEAAVPVSSEVPFNRQMDHFVNVVKGLEKPRTSGAEGLSALMVCHAIKRAMIEQKPIEIP